MREVVAPGVSTVLTTFFIIYFSFHCICVWFQRYIVECEKEVLPPAYLRHRSRGTVKFDLTPIMRKKNTDSTRYLVK